MKRSAYRRFRLATAIIALSPIGASVAGADAPQTPPPKAPPNGFLIDAGACPRPDGGPYSPKELSPYERTVREMLVPKARPGVVLQMIVEASFKPPMLIAVEDTEHAGQRSYVVRVVRAKVDLWGAMMSVMQKQQGSSISLAAERQRNALAKVARRVVVRTAKLDEATVPILVDVWDGILDRTQYVKEVLTAGDQKLVVHKADGTTFQFWHGGRSAVADDLNGSVLDAFVRAAEDLAQLPEAAPDVRSKKEQELQEQFRTLLKRINTQEPCLKARPVPQ